MADARVGDDVPANHALGYLVRLASCHSEYLKRIYSEITVPYFAAGLLYVGNAGRRITGGGFFFNSSIATSTAFSSCGSRPFRTSAGSCSTSTSGGTPMFSTSHSPVSGL